VATASAKRVSLDTTTIASAFPKLKEWPTVPLDVHIPTGFLPQGQVRLFYWKGSFCRALLRLERGAVGMLLPSKVTVPLLSSA